MKRFFDIAAAAGGLVVTAPVLLLISLAVKATSPGPVFFRQERLGRYGRVFRIFKFRTMRNGADHAGSHVTAGGDGRITTVGRWLRRHKLDELPQLLNVLRGEMSFVGPRPEVPEFAGAFPEIYRRLLQVRPGITHRVSLAFRNEEQILAAAEDPERMYMERVMPSKMRLYVDGLSRQGVFDDVRTIVDTIFNTTEALTLEELERVSGAEDTPAAARFEPALVDARGDDSRRLQKIS